MKCLPLILTLIFVSCSTRNSRDGEELLTIYEPKWFSANERHSLRDSQGDVQPHLFFDVNPEFTEKEQLTNVVITTLENSWMAYDVDVVSGQRYFSHAYCNQGDVWNQRSGTYGAPYFSIGYIPRVLDQTGKPQKVLVFGNGDRLEKSLDYQFVRVRVIGGYVEENCLELNCLGRDNWTSRLVFVAVDPQDPNFRDITDVEGFLTFESWEKLQTTLQNMDGRNFSVEQSFPAVRIRNLVNFPEMIKLFRKRSAYLSDTEALRIQRSCHALYDKLWKDVGEERGEDKVSKTQKELEAKLRLMEKLRGERKPVGKMARFRKFIKKYFTELGTCEKFIYHGNINRDPEHFWFLSWIGIYTRLHKEGYYFDCKRQVWAQNIYTVNGEPAHDLRTEIDFCSARDMDRAMEYLPNHLRSLKGVMGPYYRFVDYDTHEFGTHRKLYSWVKEETKKFDCRPDPNEMILQKLRLSPEDARWKRWEVIDVARDLKIIY